MKFLKMCRISLSIYLLFAAVSTGEQVELSSVEHRKDELVPASTRKYEGVTCTFESIFSIELGKNVLAIRINNISEKEVRISKFLLGLDQSYKIKFNDKLLPYSLSNDQANNDLEIHREKLGLRWLIIPPKGSVLVSLDPMSWQAIEDLSIEHRDFKVEITSILFDSRKGYLTFTPS